MCLKRLRKTIYHDPNFGLVIKIRAYKGASQKWSPRITFHAPESVGGCEGMNPHNPKWIPTLGIEVPMDFWIFKERLQGVKNIWIKDFFIPLESSQNINV